MSELETGGAVAAPEAAVVANTDPVSVESTMASVYDKHFPSERVNRGEGGKFESKKAEGADVAEPAPEITKEPVADKPETVKAETPAPSIKARPQSLAAEHDDWWKSLPSDKQDLILKREGETHQKITQLGEKAAASEKFAAIIDRHRQIIGNAQPEQEIENLFQTKAALLRDPQGSIKWLADQLGVDLSQYAKQAQGDPSPESDQTRALLQKVSALERQLSDTTNRLSARELQEKQSREQSLDTIVSDFSKDKDYWKEIEGQVLEQIHAIKAVSPNKDPKEILQEAHDRALKLNDEVSTRLNKTKREKEEADKTAADKRKADEAKRLASLNTKSASGASPKQAFKSFESEMADVYDRVAGG